MGAADTRGDRIVVGLFDRQEDAAAVIHDLQDRGVPASSIHTDEREPEKPTLLQRLKQLVTGTDSHQYAEGVRRGGIVVSAAVPAARVAEAVSVMEQHHAVDVERRSESWQGPAVAAPEGGPRQSEAQGAQVEGAREQEEAAQGRVRVYSRVVETPIGDDVTVREEHVVIERQPLNRPQDEEPGMLPDLAFDPDLVEVVVVQETRLVEPERESGPEGQDRDDPHPFAPDFEHHHRSQYDESGTSYDQYEAAYRWGYMLANQDEWRGRPWGDVAGYAERTWEERQPGTWDRFKDAIRYGWDRLTGRSSEPSER